MEGKTIVKVTLDKIEEVFNGNRRVLCVHVDRYCTVILNNYLCAVNTLGVEIIRIFENTYSDRCRDNNANRNSKRNDLLCFVLS
jgi:hypothetical protein